MEGGEKVPPSTTAAITTAVNATASPLPLVDPSAGPDLTVAETENHAMVSDEEHGHEIDHDHDLDHEHDDEHDPDEHLEHRDHAALPAVSTEDLKLKIIKQVSPSFFCCSQTINRFVYGVL